MTTVLHYVDRWLPLSQQFVHGQVCRSRHRAVVVSRRTPENLDAFPVGRVWSLEPTVRLAPGNERRARTAALAALALAHRAAVVHVHFGYRVHDVSGIARRLRLPVVVSLHGHDATAFPREYPQHYGDVLGRVEAVVVPSRFLAARATELGAPEDRVHVIPSGVDPSFFRPCPRPSGPPVVLFVGRLVEKKGVDVLLDAWPAVRAAVPDARLRVLGYGQLAAAVTGASGEGVDLVAPQPHWRGEQVRDELCAAAVVVTPSRTPRDGDAESLLLVNLEAQAVGRPVVTTRHGGIPEFVEEGVSAIVVPEADAVALAGALTDVLRDGALADRLGAGGPAVAAHFDVSRSVAAVDALYDQLATRR